MTLCATWSLNGGGSWAANVAVADAPTNGYATNGAQELGDYTGAAFYRGILYPSWADSSNSTGDNPNGALTNLEVYVAAVRPRKTVSVAPASGAEGATIVLSGAASDPNSDPLTFSWTVTADAGNDAGAACAITAGGTSLTPSIQCSDDGTYTATLTATGDPAGPVSASNTVTVSNADPVVTSPANTPDTIDKGQSTTFSASFSDAGWNDTYGATIDWGFAGFGPPSAVTANVTTQGSPSVPDSGDISGTQTYLDDGAFTVTGTVTDDDGGSGSASAGVTVNNVDPTAAIDDTGTILINGVPTIITNAGSPVDFSGDSTDPGSDDLTLTWDWDDSPPAPDVTTVSLHDPLIDPDPDPSPGGMARDVTDDQTHTFGEACFYDVVFASADDDGGSAADDIAVVIVGNFADSRSHGYFKNEIRRPRDHSAAGIQCLLDITGFMSQVFNEVRDASTPAAATAVFNKAGSSVATDIFDVQLLAAWMNFADGRVALTDLVDTNRDGVPDTVFSTLMAEAEAVRLNPASTQAEILAQATRLDSFVNSGI